MKPVCNPMYYQKQNFAGLPKEKAKVPMASDQGWKTDIGSDAVRGVGEHHSRVAFESLENLGDASNRHPVEVIEPTPERVADIARACVVQLLREMRPLTVRERETVFLRIWDMPWHGIAAVLQLESVQSAEWQLRAALRKCPALRSLFPKTNNREKTNGR